MSNELGHQLSIWTLLPFVLMLLGIAILPLVAERWFEPNRNKAIVSAVLGVPTLIYLFAQFGSLGVEAAADTAEEYVSFIILLLALYTISGGIYLTGNLVATPRVNVTFLVVGAVLASFIGTMGASMLLIRPLLRANSERTHSRHTVVFFIFAVSNMGGMLTPLGDPPLFLGFLRGVPFGWTLRLWPQWLLGVGLVLLAYLAVEIYQYRREPAQGPANGRGRLRAHAPQGRGEHRPLRPGHRDRRSSPGNWATSARAIHFPFVREVILVVLAILSHEAGPARAPGGQPFQLGAHHRGGGALRRHLRHHDPRAGAPGGQGRDDRPHRALAVLLG